MSHFAKHYPFPFAITLFCSAGGHVFFVVVLLVLGLIPLKPRTRITWLNETIRVKVQTPGPAIKGKNDKILGVERIMDVANATPKPAPEPTPAPKQAEPEPSARKIVVPTKEPPKPTHKTPALDKRIITKAPKVRPTPKKEISLPAIPSPLNRDSGKETKVAAAGPPSRLPPLPSMRDSGRGGPYVDRKGDPNGSAGSPTGMITAEGNVFLPFNYGSDAQGRIQANFTYPSSLRGRANTTCVLRFRIQRNGTIDTIEVMQSTGQPRLDDFAKEALIETRALLPLPDTIKDQFITVTVPFSFGEGGQ